MPQPHRLPISARHAFALALDLAVRRDAVQSLLVPFLLALPWVVAQAMLAAPDEAGASARDYFNKWVWTLGYFLVSILVAAMLRFRARSVYNTPLGTRPDAALHCYSQAVRRLPWLYVTEFARNVAIGFGLLFALFPGVWVGFRLSLATEAAVLRDHTAIGAFTRSFHLTGSRLERWLEMIALSVVLVLSLLFTCVVGFFALPHTTWSTWATVALCVLPLVMSVIQYAWTFFYLRLEEIDVPLVVGSIPSAGGRSSGTEGGTSSTAGPKLRLVEGRTPSEPPAQQ